MSRGQVLILERHTVVKRKLGLGKPRCSITPSLSTFGFEAEYFEIENSLNLQGKQLTTSKCAGMNAYLCLI